MKKNMLIFHCYINLQLIVLFYLILLDFKIILLGNHLLILYSLQKISAIRTHGCLEISGILLLFYRT